MKMEQNTEKNMTHYDRKVLARQAAAKQEKKKDVFNIIFAALIIVCIAALLIISPILKRREAFREYFTINGEAVSELEFNFHKTNLVNNNAQILQYLGMTSYEDLDSMMYDEQTGTSWSDYFTERAAVSIKENKALIADAKAKNISLDVNSEYKAYMEQLTEEAESMEMTLDAYLTAMYGAPEKDLKDIMKDNITALLYSEKLSETYAASDADAQAEYDSKKDEYDSVDYRVLPFMAAVTSESNETEVLEAMDAAKAQAQEMLDKVLAGEDFETLCATYAPEDKRAEYADETTDLSLVTGASSTYAYDPYLGWLFDAERESNDTIIYTDTDNKVHYLLLFEKRYLGEGVMDSIKETLTYDAVTAYINDISADYVISDESDNLPTI